MSALLYHDKGNTRTGMSDEAVEDEREAIAQAAKAIAACRSELLDAQAKMNSTRNKDDLQDMLDWLPDDATKWAERANVILKETVAGL